MQRQTEKERNDNRIEQGLERTKTKIADKTQISMRDPPNPTHERKTQSSSTAPPVNKGGKRGSSLEMVTLPGPGLLPGRPTIITQETPSLYTDLRIT